MDAATRPGVRPAHLALGAIVATACVAVAAGVLILRGGGGAVSPLPVPAHVALVYAMPVGKRFIAHREFVYAASPTDAHPVRLAAGTVPMLSPNGRVVAYVGGSLDHPTGLRLIGSLGGASRPVGITGPQPTVWAWSWNSRLLAVDDAHGLVVVDARSLRSTRITLPEASSNFSFSPDGSMLAYQHSTGSGTDIYTVAVSGGAIHRLTEDGRSSSPLWGPRGIAFERFTGRCCHGDVWLMNATGGDAHELTHTHAGIYPAAWSADGSRMVAAYPATNNGKLYAVDVSTGRARALTPFVGDLGAYGLSRNGRTVLAAIGCGELGTPYGLVETIPFAGGAPTTIVRGPCRASSNF